MTSFMIAATNQRFYPICALADCHKSFNGYGLQSFGAIFATPLLGVQCNATHFCNASSSFGQLEIGDPQLAAAVVAAAGGPHQLLAVGREDRQHVGAGVIGDPRDGAAVELAVLARCTSSATDRSWDGPAGSRSGCDRPRSR